MNAEASPEHLWGAKSTWLQVGNAARVMGDTAMFDQMEAASALIKRDVVFAASLYLA